jgi:hypothetical protein
MGRRFPGTVVEATHAAAIGAAPGTATEAARAESANATVPGPLLPSPPKAPHRSPAPALAVSRPPAPPSRSHALRSGPPPMSTPPGEIYAQDTASPVPVFTVANATDVGGAAASRGRSRRLHTPNPTHCLTIRPPSPRLALHLHCDAEHRRDPLDDDAALQQIHRGRNQPGGRLSEAAGP